MTDPSDEAIAAAAYEEFLSLGYDGASLANIARALGVDSLILMSASRPNMTCGFSRSARRWMASE